VRTGFVAVPDRGRKRLPDTHRDQADRDRDDECPAHRLANEDSEGAGLVTGAAWLTESDLQGKPRYGEMHQTITDETGASQDLQDPIIARRTSGASS
jgi:hypothetical protein